MKAFVTHYNPIQEHPGDVEVRYDTNPKLDWRYATREAAEEICSRLNQFELRVGTHQCAFSIDPLHNGDFGIFCVCHPGFIPAGSSASPKGHEERA